MPQSKAAQRQVASPKRRGSESSATSALLLSLIHRSAWNGHSANFAFKEFSEVRTILGAVASYSQRKGACRGGTVTDPEKIKQTVLA
jgi:hypothetical protein